jgi:ribosomal protein L21
MFAIVRTGGKQYRVAAGDKIAVEKIEAKLATPCRWATSCWPVTAAR